MKDRGRRQPGLGPGSGMAGGAPREPRNPESRETVSWGWGGAERQVSGGGKGSAIARPERAPRPGSAPRGAEGGAAAGPAPLGACSPG